MSAWGFTRLTPERRKLESGIYRTPLCRISVPLSRKSQSWRCRSHAQLRLLQHPPSQQKRNAQPGPRPRRSRRTHKPAQNDRDFIVLKSLIRDRRDDMTDVNRHHRPRLRFDTLPTRSLSARSVTYFDRGFTRLCERFSACHSFLPIAWPDQTMSIGPSFERRGQSLRHSPTYYLGSFRCSAYSTLNIRA